jgi:hypothetical protein
MVRLHADHWRPKRFGRMSQKPGRPSVPAHVHQSHEYFRFELRLGPAVFLTALAANANAPGMISIRVGVFPISSPSASIHAGGIESILSLLARADLTSGLL